MTTPEEAELKRSLDAKQQVWDEGVGDRICVRVATAASSIMYLGLSAASAGEMWTAQSLPERVLCGAGFVVCAFAGVGAAALSVREVLFDSTDRAEIQKLQDRLSTMQTDRAT
jgi:hypothetical protein